MENKISVIVPIYNVEKYLDQCITSILRQTYKNLEVILVNDGSTDNCLSICNRYKQLDSRIVVINKENGGLSSARNAGLDIATGEYIAFVDADDWLEDNMYSVLLNNSLEYNADIVTCAIFEAYEDGKCSTSISYGEVSEFHNITYLDYITNVNENIRFEVWNKLYRATTIANARFKERQVYEDIFFQRVISTRVNKVVRIDIPLYNYRKFRIGNTNSQFNLSRLSVFRELEDFYIYLKDRNRNEAAQHIACFGMDMSQQLYLAAIKFKLDRGVREKIMNGFTEFYKKGEGDSFKYRLFYMSPSLYVLLYKIKSLL